MPRQPGIHLGMLVGGIVIEYSLDQLAGRHHALDCVEEADEFLVPVALHAAANHRVLEHVQRREQRRGVARGTPG
jgi:hypothetical protein